MRGGVEPGSGALLGTLAKSASASAASVKAPSRHIARWRIRDAIVTLLPGCRTEYCGTRAVPSKNAALKIGVGGGAYLANVRRCGSVWHCPYCAAKIARGRAEEIREAITAAKALGLHVTLATFTVQHTASDELPELLVMLTDALRRWRSGRVWQRMAGWVGYVGSIRNLEVTWGEGSGWHPHSHCLLFTEKPVDGTLFEREARVRWSWAANAAGGYASDIHGLQLSSSERDISGYLTKVEREVDDATEGARSWAAAEELAFSHLKAARGRRLNAWGLVAGLLATGWAEYADRFVEYAAAFHGRRHLYWSRGLRDLLGLRSEATDVELAEAEGQAGDVVVVFTELQLKQLMDSGRLGECLALAEERGGDAAWWWCQEFFGLDRVVADFSADWWTQEGWLEAAENV